MQTSETEGSQPLPSDRMKMLTLAALVILGWFLWNSSDDDTDPPVPPYYRPSTDYYGGGYTHQPGSGPGSIYSR